MAENEKDERSGVDAEPASDGATNEGEEIRDENHEFSVTSRDDPAPPATVFPDSVPLISALKAWGARRVFEQCEKAYRAKANLNDSIVEHEKSLVRLEHIDTIGETERKQIQKEYDDIDRAARRAEELFDYELEAEKAKLIATRKRHEAAALKHDREINPLPQLPPPDPIRAGFEEIKLYAEYEREIDEWWAGVVEEAGGEENVSETQRAMLDLHRDYLATEMERRARRED